MMSREIDMLHGPLLGKILLFALPLAVSSVLQQLFNSVDVAVVGHFASSEALAAVGSNAPVISLLVNLFIGLSMGANVVIANHIGKNDEEGIRRAISTMTVVSLVCGFALLALGVAIARPILTWMGTPADVLDMAVSYLRIYFLGMPFVMIFNFGSAILRSRGDTRRPLYILIAAGLVNTVFNLIFVICFKMGVEGVAIATGIANALSAFMITMMLHREPEPYRIHPRAMKIYREELAPMIRIGVPAGLQGVVFSISNVVVQSAINSYGPAAIAGSAAAMNYEFYCYYVVEAFNGAAISFIGQNYGAGNKDRVRQVFLICMSISVVTCLFLNWMFVSYDDFFLGLFSTDPDVHVFGRMRLHHILAYHALICTYEIGGSCLRGMGRSLLPAVQTILGTCVLRLLWVYAVTPHLPGFENLLKVYPISWIATGAMVLASWFVIFHRWKPGAHRGITEKV